MSELLQPRLRVEINKPNPKRYWQMNYFNWEYVWDMHHHWLSSPWWRTRYLKFWIVPMICGKTHSKRRAFKMAWRRRSELLHMGRDCPTWNSRLGSRWGVSLRTCSGLARRRGYKSFMWKKSKFNWRRGKCFVDRKLSRTNPYEAGGKKPNDKTCECGTIECTGEPNGVTGGGWMAQKPLVDLPQLVGHYAVVTGGWGRVDQMDDKLYGGVDKIFTKAKPLMTDF